MPSPNSHSITQPENPSDNSTEAGIHNQDSTVGICPQFSGLPTEIRLQIWRMANQEQIQRRRVITIEAKPHSSSLVTGRSKLALSYSIPPLVHVNRESREVALKIYTFSFSRQLGGKGVYFAYLRDLVHFKTAASYDMFIGFGEKELNGEVDEKIKFLAVGPNPDLPW